MSRPITLTILATAFAVGMTPPALADGVPTATNTTLYPADALGSLFMTPSSPSIDPATRNVIFLHDDAGSPLVGVEVKMSISSDAICICPDAVLSGTTNADGTFEFITAGGGYDARQNAAVVYADGIVVRKFAIKSPDFNGQSGDCLANLPDLVALSSCLESPCVVAWDFDNTGGFELGDVVLYGRSFVGGQSCR